MNWQRWLTGILFLLAGPSMAYAATVAQEEAPTSTGETPPASIESLVVTGTRSPRPLQKNAASISIVGPDALTLARPGVSLGESLARVPGLLVQESGNFAQDARIQIRGFGTRAAFGIREIKVLVDGLPATLADGQTQIDDLDLAMTDRVEVLRGASASLYGNAAGGVVQIFTREPPENPGVTARVLGGSFGLLRASAQADTRWESGGGYLGATWMQQDGYRDHARTRSANLSGKAKWDLSDTIDLTLLLQAVDAPQAQDPGGLTIEEVEEDRRSARERNVLLRAGEEVQQVRLGLVGSYQDGPHSVDGNISLLYRSFFARLPILPQFGDGVVGFDRISPSGGLQYQWNGPLWGWTQRITTGLEVQHQNDDRRRWANEEGNQGALGLHQVEEVTGIGVFLREDFEILPEVELTGGIRYDAFFYAVDVRFPADSGDSGNRTMDRWSPSAGILWTPDSDLSVFASFSTAFQVPTTTELVNPNRPGFNDEIKPQTAQSWEVGSRYEHESLTLGLAFFLIDLQDELIPYETLSGRVAFRNAGRSQRRGVELEGSGKLPMGFGWTLAAAALDAKYISYTTDNGQFDGNAEPGIPPWQAFGELSWRGDSGLYLAAEVQGVGAIPVDDANLAKSPAYVTLGLRMAWTGMIGKHWQVQPFAGVRNLNGATYDGTLRINARGGRFYEPAARLNWYAGFEASWTS
ncbi:MAG: TonB-dependent receptor [Candidatus Binatia bacterium]|nr:TonB-dependent receptor [Candidatus Binatia bacterium]MDG1959736.1 TonB-dependent receptor [Candidatus Binatia bacterium]MDG2010203.1 TonB-dependent receptor [Candidatus Binatia bacterium]